MWTREARPAPPRWVLVAAATASVVALVVALAAAGGAPVAAAPGLPDTGVPAGWVSRGAELAGVLAGMLVVGSLLVPAVLVPAPAVGPVPPQARTAAGHALVLGCAWASLSVLQAVLAAADTAGVPPSRLLATVPLRDLATGQAGAHLLVAALAAGVAAGLAAGRGRVVTASRWALVAALGALLPPVLVGHAGSVSDEELAATGIVVHAVAAALWVGGLAGIMLHLRRTPDLLAAAARRFSHVALGAYVALAVSGLVAASTRLDLSWASWSSGYGAVVEAKVVLLLLLGAAGHAHRSRTLPALAAGGGRPFVRLAAVELALMGAAAGLAAALARTPPPALPTVPEHGAGHTTLPGVVDPLSPLGLVAAVRPNALSLLVVAAASTAYWLGVRRVRRACEEWPPHRTRAATAAAAAALVTLCSGVATYAPAMLSVQVVQLLLALLVVPALLALAAPVELHRRCRPSTGYGVAPGGPVGGVAVGVLLVLVYRTPLVEYSQQSHWLHLLVLLSATCAGLAFLDPVLSPVADRPAEVDLLTRASRLVPVVCLLALAVQLALGDRLLAATWFLELRWSWVDPVVDQRRAGLVAGTSAVLLVAVVLGAERRRGRQPGGQSVTSTRPSRSSAPIGP